MATIKKSFYNWCIENNHKDFLELWDYELNSMSPKDVSYGTNKMKYYFKCSKGLHESEAQLLNSITSRNKVYCNKCNSFEHWCIDNKRGDFLNLWDYELNKVLPCDINFSTSKKYYFKCPRGLHQSELKRISCLTQTTNGYKYYFKCYQCESFEQWCIDNNKEILLELWDYELNDKNPSEISHGTPNKYYFKCDKGLHKSELKPIVSFTVSNSNYVCNQCNSFAQWCIDNDKNYYLFWDYIKNNKSPFEVSKSTDEKYWFKCINNNKNHISELKIVSTLTYGSDNFKCKQCESFGQWLLDNYGDDALDIYWSDKNTSNPFEVHYNGANKIWIKCSKHGDYLVTCSKFNRGDRCPICSNNKIVRGINDLHTTNPDMVKYFVDINDTYKHSYCSGKIVSLKCPHCGNVKNMPISSLYKQGFGCNICSDKISYPNKFIFSLLQQLKINYVSEQLFDWSNNRRYDFYIPEINCIIEAHGGQHYNGGFDRCGGRTLEEEQENDKLKQRIALENNIKHYVILDCQKSELNWIKKSVMNSKLPNLFNFEVNDIDWLECHEHACNNIVKDVCIVYKTHKYKPFEIQEMFNIGKTTYYRYLRKGKILEWC